MSVLRGDVLRRGLPETHGVERRHAGLAEEEGRFWRKRREAPE